MSNLEEQIQSLREIIAEESPAAIAYWTEVQQADRLEAKNKAGYELFKLTKRWINPLANLLKSQSTKNNTFVEVPQHLLYISGILEKARDMVPKKVFMEWGFRDFDFRGWDLLHLADDHPMRFRGSAINPSAPTSTTLPSPVDPMDTKGESTPSTAPSANTATRIFLAEGKSKISSPASPRPTGTLGEKIQVKPTSPAPRSPESDPTVASKVPSRAVAAKVPVPPRPSKTLSPAIPAQASPAPPAEKHSAVPANVPANVPNSKSITPEVSLRHESSSLPTSGPFLKQSRQITPPTAPKPSSHPAATSGAPSAEKRTTGPPSAVPASSKAKSAIADPQPAATAEKEESAKRDRAETIGDSPGPARKRSKQKINISPEMVPPECDSNDSNATDEHLEKYAKTFKDSKFFEQTQVDESNKKVTRGIGVLTSPPSPPVYPKPCERCKDNKRSCTGWPGWACDKCRVGKQGCSFDQFDWRKKQSYLEWTANGGVLVGGDEEKSKSTKEKSKSTKGKDDDKRPDVKQKKGKAKATEGEEGKLSKPRKPRYEEIPLRRPRTPAPSQASSLAPEGPMDVDLQPAAPIISTSNPLPSTSQPSTIPPPGPLSADHVQWIMASIARLEAKIDNFKEDVKRLVIAELKVQQQALQLPSQPLQGFSTFPQQLPQPAPPPVFPQLQQPDMPFSAQDIVDWGNTMYSQQGLLPRTAYRMDDALEQTWNVQNSSAWPGDGSGGQGSGGHIHR